MRPGAYLSSNPKFMPAALSPAQAIELMQKLVAHPQHVFWEDQESLVNSPFIPRQQIRGHLQITDAYLLGLACSRSGSLATLDQGIPSLAVSPQQRAAIVVIPP
jgi:hypothetical protein